jgi:T4-like virus Myoviridae tail sheath stabiliser
MSQYFYDGQVRRYLTQFMRVMSNFSYKDGSGRIVQVPVMYGDPSRQASAILKKNSENTVPSAPFIACYIKGLDYDQNRLQDPTFISKVQIREREYDEDIQRYVETQGQGYTVERMMPAPYKLTFNADMWTTNTDQKLQIFEQISYFFNPAMELQTTDNYVDWTSLTVLYLKQTNWTSRQVPQGTNQDIDILTLTFETPIWITPPAKVKKMGVITKIIANVFSNEPGTIASEYDSIEAVYDGLGERVARVSVNPGNFELLILDNVASIVHNEVATDATVDTMPNHTVSWLKILDLYPGQFRANLSQLRLTKPDGNEIVAFISLDPFDERRMLLNIDTDTIPTNTVISGRGTVDAIVNPETYNPNSPAAGTRYLILENINSDSTNGPSAWLNSDASGFTANANDIIEWNGSTWSVVFNSQQALDITYITNIYTGIQYKWDGESWSKSFEGIYDKDAWRILL